MILGIDISQMAYENTGVANFVKNLVENLIDQNPQHEYKLFYASFRKPLPAAKYWATGGTILTDRLPKGSTVTISQFKIPPTALDFLWNRLHIMPIEQFIGKTDIFISSDWTQPPSRAKKTTILYDLVVYKYPSETSQKIGAVHKRKLAWVKREIDKVICISEATKKDAIEILGIDGNKCSVVYPGI